MSECNGGQSIERWTCCRFCCVRPYLGAGKLELLLYRVQSTHKKPTPSIWQFKKPHSSTGDNAQKALKKATAWLSKGHTLSHCDMHKRLGFESMVLCDYPRDAVVKRLLHNVWTLNNNLLHTHNHTRSLAKGPQDCLEHVRYGMRVFYYSMKQLFTSQPLTAAPVRLSVDKESLQQASLPTPGTAVPLGTALRTIINSSLALD